VGEVTRLVRWLASYHLEAMYHRCFLDLKQHLGITTPFYPVGSAANASLLYVVARAVSSLPITAVCELGCGQTTRLFDALAVGRPHLRVTSLEEDEFWAREIGSQIQARTQITILRRTLTEQMVRGRAKTFYDIRNALEGRTFDFLLVDGPAGERRHSRWGSLSLIDQHLGPEFLIVFDDAERAGERDTYLEAQSLLRQKGIRFYTALVQGRKSQFVMASAGMRGACYF
jgi:hypothetical protein